MLGFKFSSYPDPSKKSKTCLCTCRSHCTTYNASTNSYEGNGNMLPRGTRDNHLRDDKRLATQERTTSPSWRSRIPSFRRRSLRPSSVEVEPPPLSPPSVEDANLNFIRLLKDELLWYCELPLSSPHRPLQFIHDPASNDQYATPPGEELLHPNAGLYALRLDCPCNTALLATESRLCEMVSLLTAMDRTEEGEALIERIQEELDLMSREKGVHWDEQRGNLSPDRIFVNTGNFLFIQNQLRTHILVN